MKHKVWKILLIVLILALLLTAAALIFIRLSGGPEEPLPTEPVETEPPRIYDGKLQISEYVHKNAAGLRCPCGEFTDWAEIRNISSESLSLEGFHFSDKEDELKWSFPSRSLEPGEYMLIYCGKHENCPDCSGFSLSEGEELFLFDPYGYVIDSVSLEPLPEGASMARDEKGNFAPCLWPTPGFENTPAGYEESCEAELRDSGLLINEVMVSNLSYGTFINNKPSDWVELKNNSQSEINLSGLYLSDDIEELGKWAFPEQLLYPGELFTVYCPKAPAEYGPSPVSADFSLDAQSEALYLSDSTGRLLDYVHLRGILPDNSMGRMDGQKGFFYFTQPSPGEENFEGQRRVSASPSAKTPDGSYDGVSSLSVELEGPGHIFYTTDGSVPNQNSLLYEGPISIDKTTVIRAVSIEEGCVPGRVTTLTYFLNENHSLPLLSLVVDDYGAFNSMYGMGRKGVDIQANLAFYNDPGSFNHPCSVSMKGWTSLSLPKKSMGVSFKGMHGGMLETDVFENGIDEYASLAVRAGQDYTFAIFRNELFQELCSDFSDAVHTQQSKYAILYINGEYRGIYCLKEDFSKQYYASHRDVSPESVTSLRTPVSISSDFFKDVVEFSWQNDLSIDENYQTLCSRVEIDSLIDWYILESYCANTDTQGNLRVFRSPEYNGKWSFAFYDLDWGFYYPYCCYTVLTEGVANAGNQLPPMIKKLMQNPDFRQKTMDRLNEALSGVMSNEHVLERIDYYQSYLESEVPRDRQRWGLDLELWYTRVQELRDFITYNDWEVFNINQFCYVNNISDEERMAVFGR